jgi:hypothetical protein
MITPSIFFNSLTALALNFLSCSTILSKPISSKYLQAAAKPIAPAIIGVPVSNL